MHVVVVESPAKAKTISKYLGDDFVVLASYGHVRDLPSKDGSVRPDDDFAMTYETNPNSVKHIREIVRALKNAEHLYLATDPDREGEAISWHVLKELEQRNAVNGVDVKRIVFNEVTRGAVRESISQPRDLDMDLINAQQARRALDYLVGFTLSPVLWRKLPGSRSAGRVQSVALRLICERELEIEAFKPQEYWSIEAALRAADGTPFTARLTSLEGEQLDKFSLGNAEDAECAVEILREHTHLTVTGIEAKELQRHPKPPFTTSTLQQEAARKLRLRAQRTMQVAQRLYEGIDIGGETVGLITYMRTDGVQIASEAVQASRSLIAQRYGSSYVPDKPRAYRSPAKNAQEAHEAIRPTDLSLTPTDVARYLDDEGKRLYELIWQRTVASQMTSARLEQTAINMSAGDGRAGLRATGTVVLFDGFFKLYQEGHDDPGEAKGDDFDDGRLPKVSNGESIHCDDVTSKQHFTDPPPRYTEATLVKRLEELGIGRPSTYASIISVLQDRNYVSLDRSRFIPDDRGRLVTAFLSNFFTRYVEYDFTARLEETLDDVSAGNADWKQVLSNFWVSFSGDVDDTKDLRVRQVLDALNETLGTHFFHSDNPEVDPRTCPTCDDGKLSLKLGKFGAFIGCSNYPECRYTRRLVNSNGADAEEDTGPRDLGTDPETDGQVSVRSGPYGHYVQLDVKTETENKKKQGKPKRVSLPQEIQPDGIDLETALALLALPREVGPHPETGKSISAGIGRFGPYVLHDGKYASLKKDDDVLMVGLNRAVVLLADAGQRQRGGTALKELGDHPDNGKPVAVMSGRYGPYIKHGRTNATLPKGVLPEDVTMETAVTLLSEKTAKKGKGRSGGRKGSRASRSKATPDAATE
jgi:DNA topoisomerase-1